MSFSLAPGPSTANKHGMSWMELNTSPEVIWLKQPTHNCWVLNLSRKPQNIKCHLLLPLYLDSEQAWNGPVWTGFLCLMPLQDLRGEWESKNKVKFSKMVRSVGMGFSEVCEEDMFTPILFTQQAPSSGKTTEHGDREPGSWAKQWPRLSLAFKALRGLTSTCRYNLLLLLFSASTKAHCSLANIYHTLYCDGNQKGTGDTRMEKN